MPEYNRSFLLRLAYTLLALAGLWLGLHFLLPLVLPFLLALGLALLAEPAVAGLHRRLRLPRPAAAALCAALLALAGAGLLALLLGRLWREAVELPQRLPALLDGLSQAGQPLEIWLCRLLTALPQPLRETLLARLETFMEEGAALPDRLSQALAALLVRTAGVLPAAGLFLFTALLAFCFISADLPRLRRAAWDRVPPPWRGRAEQLATALRVGLGGWLRAQGLLMLITFAILLAGLLLLRADAPLLAAALTALLDALPVLGTGAVLLPWAALALLTGDPARGVGLLLLYAAATLIRSLLEPRLLGRSAGLHPLAALMCMYVGLRAFGVAGLILLPLLALLALRLWQAWRQPLP